MIDGTYGEAIRRLIFEKSIPEALKFLRTNTTLGLAESFSYMDGLMKNELQLNWLQHGDATRDIYVNDVYIGDLPQSQLITYRSFIMDMYELVIDEVRNIRAEDVIKCKVSDKDAEFEVTWKILRQERLSLDL